jgi:sugar phosphate isomerase/epimerase
VAEPLEIGYCTNVLAGRDWEEMRSAIERTAMAVRGRVDPAAPLGLGLWFSAPSAREIVAGRRAGELRRWLAERGLFMLTINGFPFGDFHQPVVKHAVYEPSWAERARLEYTLDLIAIAAELGAEGQALSISTLPLGWGEIDLHRAAGHLLECAQRLEDVQRRHGRLVHLNLEPEPGCVLQTAQDVVRFFQAFLLAGPDQARVRRHLRVCQDICHQAVMFEDAQAGLGAYARAGVAVGKVQISAGLRVPFEDIVPERRLGVRRQLERFQEPRYLHQTVIRQADGATRFFEDLPAALADLGDGPPEGEWRVHFHVPVYLARIGDLHTTQPTIVPTLRELAAMPGERDHEVETYAWGVLPQELRVSDLAEGMARELAWAREAARESCS